MRIFKCSICGYEYNEATGLVENHINPGTKWEDIPDDFTCPLCGAPKTAFEEQKGDTTAAATRIQEEEERKHVKQGDVQEESVGDESAEDRAIRDKDMGELSAGELSVLFSSLAKGCEKQHLSEEKDLFNRLADYYKGKVVSKDEKDFDDISKLVNADLSEDYPSAKAIAGSKEDRGALRAIVWSDKVSRMIKSLLNRYSKDGQAVLENTGIYVCDICGFVYVGNELPEICPICKVPNFKILQVGRG